ncbi:MAG: P27 family phage terminase small subunit [Rhodospirillales bacterium]|jgi:P27 family predicted phage terminase small subunit|nr:P27 family phage terminase small subunit [Rhodospirillales bacterium]
MPTASHRKPNLIVFHGIDAAEGADAGLGKPQDADAPPILIDEIAIAEWRRIAPTLMRNGRLTALQQTLLVGYCSTLAKAMRAEDAIAREGAYYEATSRNGATTMKRHPAVVDAEKSWNALRQFARQLGIGGDPRRMTEGNEPRRAIFK